MNIHEYQGKAVLKSFGAPVPRGFPAFTTEEAIDAAAKLGGSVWAVKSQIHAGGRGKGKFKEATAGEKGGVRIAFKPEDVGLFAQQMLNHTLVTLQTYLLRARRWQAMLRPIGQASFHTAFRTTVIGYAAKSPLHVRFELWQWTDDSGFVAVDPIPHLNDWAVAAAGNDRRALQATGPDHEAA